MSRKMHRRFQKVCRALCGLCFLWLLGLAGSSDLGQNTLREVVVQGSLAVTGFGLFSWLGRMWY